MLAAIFPFSKLCYRLAILHLLGSLNLALSVFPCINSAQTCVPENGANCRLVNENKAPEHGGVGRMGGHMATSQHKSWLSFCRLNVGSTSGGRMVLKPNHNPKCALYIVDITGG